VPEVDELHLHKQILHDEIDEQIQVDEVDEVLIIIQTIKVEIEGLEL